MSANVLFLLCDSPNSYNPLEGPNENPEAELPLTAGEYIYIYGDMDEDGFFEGRTVVGLPFQSPAFTVPGDFCPSSPVAQHTPSTPAFQTQRRVALRFGTANREKRK